MSFSPIMLAIMGIGGLIFLAGVVVANAAVVQMAHCLNSKTKGALNWRWWSAIGAGSSLVIKEYRQFVWKDRQPENRLRLGYRLIGVGLATLFGASVVGQVLRGKG